MTFVPGNTYSARFQFCQLSKINNYRAQVDAISSRARESTVMWFVLENLEDNQIYSILPLGFHLLLVRARELHPFLVVSFLNTTENLNPRAFQIVPWARCLGFHCRGTTPLLRG